MKKAIFDKYGGLDVIKLIDTELPALSANQVLVKVEAAALNPKDILVRKGKFKRLTGRKFPQSIGFDFSGTIADSNGSHYLTGDKVFGMLNGWKGRCCAEFLNISTNELYRMPDELSFEEAAGLPLAGQTALQAIRDVGRLKRGQSICINGASGGVGTLAIQIAKELGGQVTTVSSSRNLDFCTSLGAGQALSYTETNIATSALQFDVFFDVFGNYSFKKTAPILKKSGRYVTTVPKPAIFREQFWNIFRKKKAKIVVVRSNKNDIKWLHDKVNEKRLRPIMDKVFPMNEIRAAQEYIETKRAKGKVVLKITGR